MRLFMSQGYEIEDGEERSRPGDMMLSRKAEVLNYM
jgi:hypothetical protein